MNLNYAIFRSEPIYTLNDLSQIGSHNKREKKAYNSNPNIKLELIKDNIEIVPLKEKYVKGFHNLVKDYEIEHNERMKNERVNKHQIALGIDKNTLDPVRYCFIKNYATLIPALELSTLHNFITMLIRQIDALGQEQVIVINA